MSDLWNRIYCFYLLFKVPNSGLDETQERLEEHIEFYLEQDNLPPIQPVKTWTTTAKIVEWKVRPEHTLPKD